MPTSSAARQSSALYKQRSTVKQGFRAIKEQLKKGHRVFSLKGTY